jgi:hypothetical protein
MTDADFAMLSLVANEQVLLKDGEVQHAIDSESRPFAKKDYGVLSVLLENEFVRLYTDNSQIVMTIRGKHEYLTELVQRRS